MNRTKFSLAFLASFSVVKKITTLLLKKINQESNEYQTNKYPEYIMDAVRKSVQWFNDSAEKDKLINELPKIDVLHRYFEQIKRDVTGPLFRDAVYDIFGLDLINLSQEGEGAQLKIYPREIMDSVYKALHFREETPENNQYIMSLQKAEIMDLCIKANDINNHEDMIVIVNLIYGINLPGISSLERSRISLFTKNQWLVKNERDLFVVFTGKGDIDVKVYPTSYFKELTGLNDLPINMQHELIKLGYSPLESEGVFYYCNPNNETVPNSFKQKTLKVIQEVANNY